MQQEDIAIAGLACTVSKCPLSTVSTVQMSTVSTVHCPGGVSGCYSGQVPVYKNIDNINYNCPLGAKLSCIIAHRRPNKGIILDKIQFRPWNDIFETWQ